jgi:ABC-type phosphate/phosphonate transport system substrate-binding protein
MSAQSIPSWCRSVFLAVGLTAFLLSVAATAIAQPAKVGVLRIGSTGTITGNADSPKEKAGHETLRRFITEETGLANEITGQLKWEELTAKLAKGEYHLGVFQGYEFAWALEKNPGLKPLALGVNVYRYPIACAMVRRDNPATNFAGLKGQTLIVPATNQMFLNLFVERQCEALQVKPEVFFSKTTTSENVEDALDDIVDGKAQVVVIDQTSLEAFKRRKPGRFSQLKEVARSQPFPPVVIAYYGSVLDEGTLRKFKECLFNASRKDKGEMLLTLSRLTAFEAVPDDFGKVLVATRKAYPAAK